MARTLSVINWDTTLRCLLGLFIAPKTLGISCRRSYVTVVCLPCDHILHRMPAVVASSCLTDRSHHAPPLDTPCKQPTAETPGQAVYTAGAIHPIHINRNGLDDGRGDFLWEQTAPSENV